MPRFWTSYWIWETTQSTKYDGHPAFCSGHAGFNSRGVLPDDVVYIVSMSPSDRQLYLVGRMRVVAIISDDEAHRRWPHLEGHPQWWVEGRDGTPIDLQRPVPLHIAEQLRFRNPAGQLKIDDGKLDPQTLRPVRELTENSAQALDRIIEKTDGSVRFAEEINTSQSYEEGAATSVLVNRYERNRNARQQCVNHHGPTCVICGFDFGSYYGNAASGFIHVHHLKPLSQTGRRYQLDPIEDLRPICPNCHAMVHLRRPEPYSIEDIKRFIAETNRSHSS